MCKEFQIVTLLVEDQNSDDAKSFWDTFVYSSYLLSITLSKVEVDYEIHYSSNKQFKNCIVKTEVKALLELQ